MRPERCIGFCQVPQKHHQLSDYLMLTSWCRSSWEWPSVDLDAWQHKVQVGWPTVLVCLELRGLQGSRIFRLKTETVPGKLWHMIVLSKGLLSIFLPQGRTVFHPNLRQRRISFYVMPLTRIISSCPPFQWSRHPWKLPALFQGVGSYSSLTCFKGPVSCPCTDTPAPLWHFWSISLCASKSCFSSTFISGNWVFLFFLVGSLCI